MTTSTQSPAEAHGLPSLPELVAEIKRLVRRVSDASYTQGTDESRDSAALDQRNDDKVRALLGEASAAIDRLAALAANVQPKGTVAEALDKLDTAIDNLDAPGGIAGLAFLQQVAQEVRTALQTITTSGDAGSIASLLSAYASSGGVMDDKCRALMRSAAKLIRTEAPAVQAPAPAPEPVAWCQLAIGGKSIAYFDGKPMVMVGFAGNHIHTTPLYLHPSQAPAVAHGHKVTPYEPTQEMIGAVKRFDPALPLEHIRAIWWAMWGASKPPVQGINP